MDILIRDYQINDESQVDKVAPSAFEQYAQNYGDWEGFKKRISKMSNWSQSCELIVAEVNSNIVGAVGYAGPKIPKQKFFDQDWAILRMLVVSP